MTPIVPSFRALDSRAIVEESLASGLRRMYEGTFARAVPLFHAASWKAARAGFSRSRLEAQIRLGDAQLQARDFHAALTSYRFAEELAGSAVPDSADYWVVRASLAQAMRRAGQLEAAREECAAVRDRLARGGLAPPDGRAGLVAVMAAGLQAQLDSMSGDFAAAAKGAGALADRFLLEGDVVRAANQLYNAALWTLFAAEREPRASRELHCRAVEAARRALDLLRDRGRSPDDELKVELELLLVLAILVGVKLCEREGNGAAARAGLIAAGETLDGLAAAQRGGPAVLCLQNAILGLRVAERMEGDEDVSRRRADIQSLLRAHWPESELWARQGLALRFHWDHDAVPLGRADREVERMLAEAAEGRRESARDPGRPEGDQGQ